MIRRHYLFSQTVAFGYLLTLPNNPTINIPMARSILVVLAFCLVFVVAQTMATYSYDWVCYSSDQSGFKNLLGSPLVQDPMPNRRP